MSDKEDEYLPLIEDEKNEESQKRADHFKRKDPPQDVIDMYKEESKKRLEKLRQSKK